jgi:recombination protein RecT
MAKDNKELLSKINNNGNGNGKTLVAPTDNIAHYLQREDVKAQIAAALPKHLTPDRLARIVLTTIRLNPALAECSTTSLLAAAMQCAQVGLEPINGMAYLIPYNRKIKQAGQPDRWVKDVQFIIGYRGLAALARRTGEVTSIAAEPIYENDVFIYKKGFNEVLEHEPNFRNRGELIGAYAYALTKDGGRYSVVMNKQEIDNIRNRSKAKDSGPWVTDYKEMARKTVFRNLAKWLPMSIEFATAAAEDEQRELGFGKDVQAIELNQKPIEAEPQSEEIQFVEEDDERVAESEAVQALS